MKWIFLLLVFFAYQAESACTSATRSAFTANQVLTSSRLNSEFDNLISTVNSFDGGCINSGSVEAASLNSTEFAPLLKGVVQGCELSYVDTNTVGVSKCKIAVDGNLFETATQSNVTWGCGDCSVEATGSSYWVYIKDSSTFTPFISTTSPGKDGYNGTDKVVGGFYNNVLSNIATNSVVSFIQSNTAPSPYRIPMSGEGQAIYAARISSTGLTIGENADWIDGSCSNAVAQVCLFQRNLFATAPYCSITKESSSNGFCYGEVSSDQLTIRCVDDSGASGDANTITKNVICIGPRLGP